MATVKVKFRPSTVPGKEGTLYYRITHRRQSRQTSTGYKLYPEEWENDRPKLLDEASHAARNQYLRTLKEQLEKDLERFGEIIRQMDQSGMPYTAGQVMEARLTAKDKTKCLYGFVRCLARQLRQAGKERLAETYTTSTNSLLRFLGEGRDLSFAEMDAYLMKDYESYLKQKGLVANTISFYMRNLRAIYHRAVEQGMTEDRRPFKHVFTGVEKTAKRAITASVIREIKDLPLSRDNPLRQARDLFLFSFYTRGMSFVDMAHLRKQNRQDNLLTYRRRKTDQLLSIRWEKPMQEIVNRHARPESPFLLPIISTPGEGERRQYLNSLHVLNRHLKVIGRMVGCPIPLTSYCARHAWASIAQSERVPIGTISEAMGHTSERTTRIYLASLDTSAIDEANRKVIRTVYGKSRTGT